MGQRLLATVYKLYLYLYSTDVGTLLLGYAVSLSAPPHVNDTWLMVTKWIQMNYVC